MWAEIASLWIVIEMVGLQLDMEIILEFAKHQVVFHLEI